MLDELAQFHKQRMAHLFAPLPPPAASDAAREARILACLNFCRGIPDRELLEGGLQTARRALKSLLRSQQRRRALNIDQLMAILDDARLALGESAADAGTPIRAVGERHAVEAEIQAAAIKARHLKNNDHELMEALAAGEFEISPSSNLGALAGTIGKWGGTTNIAIDLELSVDRQAPPRQVRIHLRIKAGFWRWTARDGCCISRNDGTAVPLPAHDGLLHALLGGLALHGGRSIAAWAETLATHTPRLHHSAARKPNEYATLQATAGARRRPLKRARGDPQTAR